MRPLDASQRNLCLALALEGGLAVAALVVGWLIGFWPAIGMGWETPSRHEQLRAIGWGLVATLPLLAALFVLDRFPIAPLERVHRLAAEATRHIFPDPRWWQLAVVSAAAGLGEELAFRGLLQGGLAWVIGQPAGPWIGLVVAALVFGVFHWLSTTYALLAMLAGLYFGGLLLLTDSLWPPIVAHAAYDFVALWHLIRTNDLVPSKGDT
jgi:membrane protease YdiL (CAAX protease family)